jgi:hypothetical protein
VARQGRLCGDKRMHEFGGGADLGDEEGYGGEAGERDATRGGGQACVGRNGFCSNSMGMDSETEVCTGM